jgi:predicted component of type VI protein secretion system
MKESVVEAYLVQVVTALGGTAEKFTSPARRSVPDRIVTIPSALGNAARMSQPCRVVFVELKATGKSPTAAQLRDHERRRALGAEVWVIDSKEGVDEFINHYVPEDYK